MRLVSRRNRGGAPRSAADVGRRVAAEAEARPAVQRDAALPRRAMHCLREQGYTQDAVAAASKISHQRAQQLAGKGITPGGQAELSAFNSVR